MGLGSNFKIDRLIPLTESNTESKKVSEPIVQLTKSNSVDIENNPFISANDALTEPLESNGLKMNFIPSRRKTTKRVTIIIEGEFNINTIQLAKNRLIATLKNFDYLDIVLKNIIKIDITAIQLLNFIKHTDLFGQKHFTFQDELDQNFKSLLSKCGFTGLLTNNSLNK